MNDRFKEANLLIYSLLGNDEENVQLWWNSPNKGFDGRLPIDVWGENPQLVMTYLYTCVEGGW